MWRVGIGFLVTALCASACAEWQVSVSWEGTTTWTYPVIGDDEGAVEQISGEEEWTGQPISPVMVNDTGLPGTCEVTASGLAKVTIEWTGATPPPPTIKLYVFGLADASATPSVQSIGASNGLDDECIVQTFPNASKYARSIGHWYREFPVPGGYMVIGFPVSANATSFGVNNAASAGISFLASETDWALHITSDRAPTYRRAIDPQTGQAYSLLNGLDIDGNYYGDTAADVDVHGGGILAGLGETLISAYPHGPWHEETQIGWELSGLALIDGSDPLSRLVWAPGYVNLTAVPLGIGTATFSASDPINEIADSVSYILRVHFPAEKEEPTVAYNGWLHRTPAPNEQVAALYSPGQISIAIENYGPRPLHTTYTYTSSYVWTYGWRYTKQGSVSLGPDFAQVLFGNEKELDSNTQYSVTSGVQIQVSVYPGERFIFWGIPSGKVIDWLASRWGRHGYEVDSSEIVVEDVILIGYPQFSDVNQPPPWP